MTRAGTPSAQSVAVKEPAVIGYPNQKGVTIERVTYPARNTGSGIVANLFRPAGFQTNRKYAAIVVTHPFGGVKGQMSTPSGSARSASAPAAAMRCATLRPSCA